MPTLWYIRPDVYGVVWISTRTNTGHGQGLLAWSLYFVWGQGLGFDLVAQDQVGAGVAGLGGGLVLAQLRPSGGGRLGR